MIFCVEDDNSSRELMVYTFEAAGMEAAGFDNAESFKEAVRNSIPELVILDIMLPGEDGIAVLKWLRSSAETAKIPVIMATAKGSEYDKVYGLDSGADDYLTKPFGMMEMLARVKAVLRRSGRGETSDILRLGELELDERNHRVSLSGERIELTLKEYELLLMFMKNPKRVFSREQILINVWKTDYEGETRTVDVHIGTLRTKLKSAGDMIKTVRGVGYGMEEAE